MGKKNKKKGKGIPKKVIGLNPTKGLTNRENIYGNHNFLVFNWKEGRYIPYGCSKGSSDLFPFIDRGVYSGITPEAKYFLMKNARKKDSINLLEGLTEVQI